MVRGVGKSTWARHVLPDAPRFDLLDEGLYQSYLRDPSLFGRELARVPEGHWVVVDEVQRLPSLLNDVHRFIEDRRLRFALLGSSARKLKQTGTNLLAGRALSREMLPLLPHPPDTAYFPLAPDWICEVLSPSTAVLDRARKLRIYAREGVAHGWLVDPLARMLEVLRLEGGRWTLLATHAGNAVERVEPFVEIDLELRLLWDDTVDSSQASTK